MPVESGESDWNTMSALPLLAGRRGSPDIPAGVTIEVLELGDDCFGAAPAPLSDDCSVFELQPISSVDAIKSTERSLRERNEFIAILKQY